MNFAIAAGSENTANKIKNLLVKHYEFTNEICINDAIKINEILDCDVSDINIQYDYIFLNIDADKDMKLPAKFQSAGYTGGYIFMSKDFKKVMQCFKFRAEYFLNLPVSEDEFNNCMRVILSDEVHDKYLISCGNSQYILTDKDIIYVESENSVCRYKLRSNLEIKVYCTLKEISQKLNNKAFLRTHKSYIVNMNYIKNVTPAYFQLISGECIPIRKRGSKAVRECYTEFLKSRDNLIEFN